MQSLQIIVKLGLVIAVLGTMLAMGLKTPPSAFLYFNRKPQLFLRSFTAVFLAVPLMAVLVILVAKPEMPVAIAIALMAACPIAPLILSRISKLSSSMEHIASMHVIFALFALITVPLFVTAIAKFLGYASGITPMAILKSVALTIVFPVLLGSFIRWRSASLADKAGPVIQKIASVLLLLIIVLLIVVNRNSFAEMTLRSYMAIASFIVLSIAAGHWLAPNDPEQRTILAIESAGRNPGFVLAIVALYASDANPMKIILPYLIVFAIISTIYLLIRKKVMSKSVSEKAVELNPADSPDK